MMFLAYAVTTLGILACALVLGAVMWMYSALLHKGSWGREAFELCLGAGLVLLALIFP